MPLFYLHTCFVIAVAQKYKKISSNLSINRVFFKGTAFQNTEEIMLLYNFVSTNAHALIYDFEMIIPLVSF
jgi:hypothetical protein